MPNQPARADDPFKGKKTGKWSKYGGAIYGMEKEEIDEFWYCQACGSEIPNLLKPFLFETESGDFLRLCAGCINLSVEASKHEESFVYIEIVKKVRKTTIY